jgi:hypothetical protein
VGPHLDVYVLTSRRDRETIDRFVATFLDRAAVEDLGDTELMLTPLGATPGPRGLEEMEWEPVGTLTRAVERGLDYPRRAFSLYLSGPTPGGERPVDEVSLTFTTDDQVVLGVSIQDPDSRPEKMAFAKQILARLTAEFDCSLGIIGWEVVPPVSGAEFRRVVENREYTAFTWQHPD